MNLNQDNPIITAALVDDQHRLSFLPTYFGARGMLHGEATVYGWMHALCDTYNGGYWHYYTLDNGGFYMALDSDQCLTLAVDGNGFQGEMSADAAGIVVTLFALCQLASEAADTDLGDALADRYHALRDFAAAHVERLVIFRAID